MVDSEDQTDLDIIKPMVLDLLSMDKHLNFDIEKLKEYIEPVLVFKEKKEDNEKIYHVSKFHKCITAKNEPN